jgi:hypothetical protein
MNAAFTCAMICLNAGGRLWHGFTTKENAINQNCHMSLIYGGMMGRDAMNMNWTSESC